MPASKDNISFLFFGILRYIFESYSNAKIAELKVRREWKFTEYEITAYNY